MFLKIINLSFKKFNYFTEFANKYIGKNLAKSRSREISQQKSICLHAEDP